MSFVRVLWLAAASTALCGCSLFGKLQPDCHSAQEYQHALSAPPLKVPAGMDSPNTTGSLAIPNVELAAPAPGPNDACYDVPPRYVAAPANKAAGETGAVTAPAATAAAATPTPASAAPANEFTQAGDWEFRIGPIYGFSQNVDFSNGSADIKNTLGIKTGVAYYLTDHLSVGGDFSYSRGDFSANVNNNGVTAGVQDGHQSSSTLLFDGTYNFLNGPFRPYISAGLGYTWVDTNIVSGPPVAGCWWDPWWGYVCSGYQPTRGTSSWVGQLGAGLQWNFNHEFGMSVGYRESFIQLADSKHTGFGGVEALFLWRFLGR
ncbi:MAG TPA: outer membrane beta-barrel protein [Steroidobacteraceae bacterium]|jgi:opacity protein-like surface antigen